MRLRYGDKPVEMFVGALDELDQQGAFACQQKADGFRTQIIRDKSRKIGNPSWAKGKDSSLFFLSRRDKAKGGPTQIPVKPEIIEIIEALNLPDQSALDGEWMARRTIGECPEKLFLFDVLWLTDEWQGEKTWTERNQSLIEIFNRIPAELHQVVDMPETVYKDFKSFFEKQKEIPWTEGVVLKHRESKLKGDTDKSEKNALWIKVKHRSGESGRDVVKDYRF